jgi:hypothetical protein
MTNENIRRQRIQEIDDLIIPMHWSLIDSGELSTIDSEVYLFDETSGLSYSVTGTMEIWVDGVVGYVSSMTNKSYIENS